MKLLVGVVFVLAIVGCNNDSRLQSVENEGKNRIVADASTGATEFVKETIWSDEGLDLLTPSNCTFERRRYRHYNYVKITKNSSGTSWAVFYTPDQARDYRCRKIRNNGIYRVTTTFKSSTNIKYRYVLYSLSGDQLGSTSYKDAPHKNSYTYPFTKVEDTIEATSSGNYKLKIQFKSNSSTVIGIKSLDMHVINSPYAGCPE